MVLYYHAFCLSRLGFTHQKITNYPCFLCCLRNKDPFTWWIKNMDMANWCLWAKVLFAHIGVAVSCILPVKIGLCASKFHWFTMCKGLFSWENRGKIGNLWNFDAQSPILVGKRHDNTTALYANQTLAHRQQLAVSMFLIHHVKGSLFLRKHRKNG